jgi:lipoprotein-anchoring transpeptidase ErfK/SrfK
MLSAPPQILKSSRHLYTSFISVLYNETSMHPPSPSYTLPSARAALLCFGLLLILSACNLPVRASGAASLPSKGLIVPTTPANKAAAPAGSPRAAYLPASQERSSTLAPSPLPTATYLPTALPTATPTKKATPTPTAAPTLAPTQKPTPLPANTTSYTVQNGDTLGAIAVAYHLEVLDLMRFNHISNASLIFPGQILLIPGTAGGPKHILVDLSDQRMYVYEGDQLVFQFIVSTGASSGTATGSFAILDKIPRPFSNPWGFWMPDWMGIYYDGPDLENGIHALPVLPNGQQIWGDSLGTPITYGCVVLSPQDAQTLYNWADVGTPVQIRQ